MSNIALAKPEARHECRQPCTAGGGGRCELWGLALRGLGCCASSKCYLQPVCLPGGPRTRSLGAASGRRRVRESAGRRATLALHSIAHNRTREQTALPGPAAPPLAAAAASSGGSAAGLTINDLPDDPLGLILTAFSVETDR